MSQHAAKPVDDLAVEDGTPLVSYVVATAGRRELLEEAMESITNQTYGNIEIVVVHDGDDDGTMELFGSGGPYDLDEVQFHHFDTALGVSGARNIGYENANGDILVTIDDDAEVTEPDATHKIVKKFADDPDAGILSFRIVNSYTGKVEDIKVPTRDGTRSADEEFECAYFLGTANAIRREVFETVGTYPTSFRYGFEELDLSYRALDAGYKIRYVPTVSVIHKAKPKSEGVDKSTLEQYLTNRIKVALRNLPWRHVVFNTVIWTVYTMYRSRLDPRPTFYAYISIIKNIKSIIRERNSIREETITKIKRMSGRLWY